MRTIYSGSTGLDTPITPKLCQLKPWNYVHILAALLLLASFWITDPQLAHAQNSVPVKPTGLTAAASNHQAALTWDDPSDNSITGYEYLKKQVVKLTASDGAANNEFGYSVAVDGNTAVIGAHKDGRGSAYVFIRQSGAWNQAAKLIASDGAANDYFGKSVAVHGDTIVVGAHLDDDNGSQSGSAYVFTKPANGWVTTSTAAKLTAFDGITQDYFGESVAIHGNTIVVGAHLDNDNGANSGSAYVFTKPANGWVTTSTAAKLTASDGAATDYFGLSVAVHGDTIVVGAHRDDDNGLQSGSAYVLTKPANGWVTTSTAAKLTASDGASQDFFGYSIAVHGDTIVVGAYGDDDNGSQSGSTYVFTKPTDGWATTSAATKLTASDGAASDYFGTSVDVHGNTIVVGAHLDDDNGSQSGSAYVFTKPTDGWVTTNAAAKLTASDGAVSDYFGRSVNIDGDTIVIGAYQDNDNGTYSGSAYVYELSDWSAVPDSAHNTDPVGANATSYTVTGLTNGQEYDFRVRATNALGTSSTSNIATATPFNTTPIAVEDNVTTAEDTAIDINVISNDTDADGDTLSVTAVTTPTSGGATIMAGSTTTVTYTPNANYNGTDSFSYTVSDGTDTATATVNLTVTAVNDPPVTVNDSASTDEDTAIDINVVSNDTDADGDTLSITQVTAPTNGTAAITSGSATTVTYTPNANYNGIDSFTYTVSDGTDTTTGTATINIGGPPVKPTELTAAASNNQAALTWTDPSDNSITGYEYLKKQVVKLTASDGAANNEFGYSVAVDGNTAVIGAHKDGRGSAYVFIRQSGAWNQTAKLTASDGAADDWFGESVAIHGDTIVVGALYDDDNGAESGSAYVFTKPANGWVTTSTAAKLTAFDGITQDYFGESVAIHGDTIVVGALYDDDNGAESGSAYVFTKPADGWATTSAAAKLTAFDGATDDWFGNPVAIHGDTIVVGAHRDDDNGSDSGSAYVFTKPADGWATTSTAAKLTASDGTDYDFFGYSVAMDSDTMVVAAHRDDDNGAESGSTYVFTRPANGWVTTNAAAKLTASDGAANDYFGISVAVDGDTIVVGALREDDDNGTYSGSTYVFTRPANGWVTTNAAAKLTTSDGAANDYFGFSVAVHKDTIVVGAQGDDDNGTTSGSAYVYESSDWAAVPNSAHNTDPVGANATSYTVTGLTNSQEYNFWIRATNALGASSTSDIAAATPFNTTPIAVDDYATTSWNASVGIEVVANDTDADGQTLSVTAVTTPTNGTAMILQGSATTITYTPHANYNGTDSFTYTVSDGTDTATGTVNITVEAVKITNSTRSNADLAALTVSGDALDTDFDPGITDYTMTVANSVASISLNFVTAHNAATAMVRVSNVEAPADNIPLTEGGTTVITLLVTAQDGTTTRTYTIRVTRAPSSLSPNADLAGLTISGGSLNIDFEPGITSYSVAVANSVSSVSVFPRAANADATVSVKVNGMEAPADNIPLTEGGATVITVVVTAQDGSTSRTYTITVFRAARVSVERRSGGSGRASQNLTPSFVEGSQTIRSVAENTPGGANVGAPIVATGSTGDQLSYALLGADAPLFDIDAAAGQLLTNGPLDFESKSGYRVSVSVNNSRGGRNSIRVTINLTNVNEPGTVAMLPAQPAVGRTMTAVLTDPDGRVTDITWQWGVSSDQVVWRDIAGATLDTYSPMADDGGKYLRATAFYTDGEGTGQSAQATWNTPLASPTTPETTVMPTPAAATLHPESAPLAAATPRPESAPLTAATPRPEPAPLAAARPRPEPAPLAAARPRPEPAPLEAATPHPEPAPTAAATPPTAMPSAAMVPTPPRATGVPATSAFDPAADDSGIDLWVILLIAAVTIAATAGLIILGVRITRGQAPIQQ